MPSQSNLETSFDMTEVVELFKTDFKEYYDNVYNEDIFLWSQIDKPAMTGKATEFPVPMGYNAGNSSGDLPAKNAAPYDTVSFTHKKIYAAADVERDAMAAAMSDKGAFVRFMEEPLKKIREGFTWNMERQMFGNGDGSLGTVSSVVDSGGGAYVLTMSSMKHANFEENQLVNIESGNTDLFEITNVNTTDGKITVQRESGGTQIPAGTDVVYQQKSQSNDIKGLKEVCDATSGSQYNITVARRWQSYQEAAASATLTPQLLNKVILRQEKRVGKKNGVKMGLLSYIQMEKLMNQLEDQKTYEMVKVGPKQESLKGKIGWDGISIFCSSGPFTLVPSKFVEDDRVYLLNPDHIKLYTMPKSGFVTDDTGKPFLRHADADKFEIRWAWYGQLYIAPIFQAVITGLAT